MSNINDLSNATSHDIFLIVFLSWIYIWYMYVCVFLFCFCFVFVFFTPRLLVCIFYICFVNLTFFNFFFQRSWKVLSEKFWTYSIIQILLLSTTKCKRPDANWSDSKRVNPHSYVVFLIAYPMYNKLINTLKSLVSFSPHFLSWGLWLPPWGLRLPP